MEIKDSHLDAALRMVRTGVIDNTTLSTHVVVLTDGYDAFGPCSPPSGQTPFSVFLLFCFRVVSVPTSQVCSSIQIP